MLQNAFRPALVVLIAGGCTIAFVPGCGNSSPREYAPSATSARESLDKALTTWRNGGNAEQIATASPQLNVVDYQWQAGLDLESYEILADEPGEGEAEKRFAVLLKLKNPPDEKRVQYIIIGRDPVWVFRDEDYRRTSNMEDNPRPMPRGRGRTAR